MEEEVNNVNANVSTKKSGNSGVGTFFFLVIVVAVIIVSLICGIYEYKYYVDAKVENLQTQIDELKKINAQMESNYNDALNINAEVEDDTTVETTAETTTDTTTDTTVSNETTTDTTNTVE